MVVDRLEDRMPRGEELEMLLHDVHVVAVGVQRGVREVLPLLAVIAVVVVDTHGCAAVRAECADEPGRNRRLACRAVAGDCQHHRAEFPRARAVHAHELVWHSLSFQPSAEHRSLEIQRYVTEFWGESPGGGYVRGMRRGRACSERGGGKAGPGR